MSLPETITVCRQQVLHHSGICYHASISVTAELGDKVKQFHVYIPSELRQLNKLNLLHFCCLH